MSNCFIFPNFEVKLTIEQKRLKAQHICAQSLKADVYQDPSNEHSPIKKPCLPFFSSLYLSFCFSSFSALLLITFNPVPQWCQIYHLGSSPGLNACRSHPAP